MKGKLHAMAALTPDPIVQEAVRVPEQVCSLQGGKETLESNPGRLARR
jgi:hypothetical protein